MDRAVFKGIKALSLTAVLAGCQAFPVVQQDLGLGNGNQGAAQQSPATPPNAAPQQGSASSFPRFPGLGGGTAAAGTAAGAQQVVTDPFAGQGVAPPDVPGGGASSSAASQASSDPSTPARTHRVVAGETGWSIARKYGISIQQLAAANTLDEQMTLRVGQTLNIPGTGSADVDDASAPGEGTPTPTPPSASQPLPEEETTPAATPAAKPETPDLGSTRTSASGSGQFRMPVSGSIIRPYSKGRNEGIDISAAQGTDVSAAGAGSVAAITRDTNGVPIIVVRHEGELMTVYTGLSQLSVQKGDRVSAGQKLGTAGSSGSVHFEVRQGFESVDPEDYL